MKYLLYGFATFITIIAAVDILVLNEVTRGMLGVIIAANVLVLGKLDVLTGDRHKEHEEFLLDLVDKTCDECRSGKELFLSQENFYCHLDGPLDEWFDVCKAHALHDCLNSWATKLETEE